MRKLIPGLLAIVGLSCMFGDTQSAHAQGRERFQKVFPFEGFKDYPADEQVKACKGRYENATARMRLLQFDGETLIAIRVRNMPPNALLTIWLKLAQPSPLTGAGVTALANPDDIESLAAITPSSSLTTALVHPQRLGINTLGRRTRASQQTSN